MRIVDVAAFYAPQGGGVRTYVERKLAAGARAGHEIVIIAPGPSYDVVEMAGGSKIIFTPGPSFPLDRRYHYFSDEPALHRLLDSLEPDVVEASSPWSSPSMVARWPGTAPRALFLHADPLSAYAYRWFGRALPISAIDKMFGRFWRHLRRLDEQFDLVVSPSRHLHDRLVAGGLHRVVTIPLGVEKGLFSPSLRDEGLRARLLERCALGPEATLLIGMGRLGAEKRWPMVIDAVTAAGARHPVGMVLLGDGTARGGVVRAVAHNPHIQLLAPVRERPALAQILASGDALVHGCEAETFCLAAAEARASGLPLIVPDRGGAYDQFEHGIAWRAGSAAALRAAIGDYLAGDPQGQRLRAIAAADTVTDLDTHFNRLFAAYADLVSARRAGG